MSRKSSPKGPSWSFYLTRDKKYGHQYVIGSYSKWDVEKQQPRIAERVHVGRLCDDGSIRPGKTFLQKFPQYADKEIFFFENKILDRAGYLQANPNAASEWSELRRAQDQVEPKSREEIIEEDWRCVVRTCGPSYAAWFHLCQSGLLEDLQSVFGLQDGKLLAALAVYLLCGGRAMQNFSDWLSRTYLPQVDPVNGQRISELLARVEQSKMDRFFKLRFDRMLGDARQKRAQAANEQERLRRPLTIAFDSTGISTYSETIDHAEYGHAKRDPELKQINLALACDQLSGEVIYAYEYSGSVNDRGSFAHILENMTEAGFEMDEVELVTDRGYKSMHNIQKQLNAGLKFVQGLPMDEDVIKAKLDKYRDQLRGNRFFSPVWNCSAMALNDDERELWSKSVGGAVYKEYVWMHLYYSPQIAADEQREFIRGVDAVIESKNAGRKVDPMTWMRYGKGVKEITDQQGKRIFVRDFRRIDAYLKYSGCLALRTNAHADPLETLEIYRNRNQIEAQYRNFKTFIGGERLFATQTAYVGKLFLFTLATSLRTRLCRTMRLTAEKTQMSIPGNSLDKILERLAGVVIRRYGTRSVWKPEMMTKKQRDGFTLLGVVPPSGLFSN